MQSTGQTAWQIRALISWSFPSSGKDRPIYLSKWQNTFTWGCQENNTEENEHRWQAGSETCTVAGGLRTEQASRAELGKQQLGVSWVRPLTVNRCTKMHISPKAKLFLQGQKGTITSRYQLVDLSTHTPSPSNPTAGTLCSCGSSLAGHCCHLQSAEHVPGAALAWARQSKRPIHTQLTCLWGDANTPYIRRWWVLPKAKQKWENIMGRATIKGDHNVKGLEAMQTWEARIWVLNTILYFKKGLGVEGAELLKVEQVKWKVNLGYRAVPNTQESQMIIGPHQEDTAPAWTAPSAPFGAVTDYSTMKVYYCRRIRKIPSSTVFN